MNTNETQWELYWKKIDKNGPIHPYTPELGQCWLWLASKRAQGHGYFWFDGAVSCASRFAWLLAGQELIDGLEICHSCDRGWCQNPDHLFQDTHAENMKGMKERGRSRDSESCSLQCRGAGNPSAKLSEEQVKEIRAAYKFGVRGLGAQSIAHKYEVSKKTILDIVRHESWQFV